MSYFAVIDTETTWNNNVMSLGLVVANSKDFSKVYGKYFIIEPTYKEGGMFSSALNKCGEEETIKCNRNECIEQLNEILKKYSIENILAYNATFDKSHLKELSSYKWCDIMKIAAQKKYNKHITDEYECYSNGKMKSGYRVENMIRMLTKDNSYVETHNAYYDAIDELGIIKALGLDIRVYEEAVI